MSKFTAIYYPPPSDASRVSAFGAAFTAGEAVEVDGKFRKKVLGNPHFAITSTLADGEVDYRSAGSELIGPIGPGLPSQGDPDTGDDDDDETIDLSDSSKPRRKAGK